MVFGKFINFASQNCTSPSCAYRSCPSRCIANFAKKVVFILDTWHSFLNSNNFQSSFIHFYQGKQYPDRTTNLMDVLFSPNTAIPNSWFNILLKIFSYLPGPNFRSLIRLEQSSTNSSIIRDNTNI